MVPDQIGGEVLVRLEAERGARRPQIAVVGVVAGRQVRAEAVALEIDAGDAQREHVVDRRVDHALQLDRAEIAVFGAELAAEVVEVGLGGDQVDHAARRVTSVERALRAAQDLDALHVVEVGLEQIVRGQRRAVDVDAGGRVARRRVQLRADAADREVRAGEVALGEVDVRNRQNEVRAAVDLLLLELVLSEGRNGDRHFLDVFRPALGRDGDFLFAGGDGRFFGRGRGFLREGRDDKGGRKQDCLQQGGRHAPPNDSACHDAFPWRRLALLLRDRRFCFDCYPHGPLTLRFRLRWSGLSSLTFRNDSTLVTHCQAVTSELSRSAGAASSMSAAVALGQHDAMRHIAGAVREGAG